MTIRLRNALIPFESQQQERLDKCAFTYISESGISTNFTLIEYGEKNMFFVILSLVNTQQKTCFERRRKRGKIRKKSLLSIGVIYTFLSRIVNWVPTTSYFKWITRCNALQLEFSIRNQFQTMIHSCGLNHIIQQTNMHEKNSRLIFSIHILKFKSHEFFLLLFVLCSNKFS